MKRLLVTGAGGMLGQALLPVLPREKYEIYALTRDKGSFPKTEGINVVEGDVLREASRRGMISSIKPDVLMHLAWDQSDGFRHSRKNLEWLSASLDLMSNFSLNGGERFLFAGSSSEYDAGNGTFSEDMGMASTQYGICKRTFTETARCFSEKFGLSFASARYFTLFGEGDRHTFGAIPSAIGSFLTGKRVICRAPDTVRDYVYLGDAAMATVSLLESNLSGPVNIASGVPRTMRDVFSTLARETGSEHLLAFADAKAETDVLAADIDRMKTELNFDCKTPFDEGLKMTIDWWRKTLEL